MASNGYAPETDLLTYIFSNEPADPEKPVGPGRLLWFYSSLLISTDSD